MLRLAIRREGTREPYMAVLKVRIWPDPALKEVAEPVASVTDRHRLFIDDLFDTMYEANGVGLAATQVAVAERILVIDLDPHGEAERDPEVAEDLLEWGFSGASVFINPQIIASSGDILWEEGCLSVPGYTEKVKRKENVTVTALDRHGEPFETHATGLFSVALQHEMDHLEGRVFVEYLSKMKRDLVRKKMERLKVEAVNDGVAAAAMV